MLDEAVIKLKDEMINALCTSLRIESDAQPPTEGKPNGEGAAQALEHALRTAAQMGFLTKDVDGQVGWAEYGEGQEMVAVLGHLDVVPAGDGWTRPPFAGMIDDGRIYGRGTMDNKGPIFAALYGMKAIKDSGLPLSRRIRIIFGTSEEKATFDDMAYYVAREELPVSGFTPDSDFPVIFAEKGLLRVTFSRMFSGLESTDVALESLKAGIVVNMVPDNAEAILSVNGGRVRLECTGQTAHGSTPHLGKNACSAMLEMLSRQDFPLLMQDSFSFLAHALAQETAGENLGIAVSDEESGPLTVNLGLLEGDGTYVRGSLDIRYPVTISKDSILSDLEESFSRGGFDIESISHKEPLHVPRDSALVKTLVRVFQEKTGLTDGPISTGGGTYARTMPNVLAFGPMFPGDNYAFHQPDEHIEIDRLVLLCQIYARAMYALATQD